MATHLPDLAAKITADLAYLRHIFEKADEFYRVYREALLNLESNRKVKHSPEWIPLSDH